MALQHRALLLDARRAGRRGRREPAARLGRRVLLRPPRELRPRAPGALRCAQEPLRIRRRLRLDEPRRAGGVDTQVVDLSVDFRQLVVEGIGFYRVASGGRADNPAHLDVLAGVRYFTVADAAQGRDPPAARRTTRPSRTSTGWTPSPASSSARRSARGWRCSGRTDIAGFGSDLTWNLEGDLAFLASRHWTAARAGATWTSTTTRARGSAAAARRRLQRPSRLVRLLLVAGAWDRSEECCSSGGREPS